MPVFTPSPGVAAGPLLQGSWKPKRREGDGKATLCRWSAAQKRPARLIGGLGTEAAAAAGLWLAVSRCRRHSCAPSGESAGG